MTAIAITPCNQRKVEQKIMLKKSTRTIPAICLWVIAALPMSTAMSAGISEATELDPVRGVVKSFHAAIFSVDLNARVLETPVRTGDYFSKGDVLLKLDCERQNAEATAARAAYRAAKVVYKSNVEMKSYGAAGELEVGVSEAEMESALAHADAIAARTKDCEIVAPFNGRVAELAINAHETSAPNQPLLKLVGNGDHELHLIVPSNWLAWLEVGNTFSFAVDETGKQHTAVVSQIGAEVDAISRTVPVIAHFEQFPSSVLPGMSGTAFFSSQIAN